MNMEKLDRDIIKFIQDDLPLSRSPYRSWAEAQGISQEEIVVRIQTMLKKGIIRRMGAVLRHQKAGYAVNAMVAWKVEESSADKVGEIMAAYKEISHCYWREVPPSFNYPLFTMIHARSEEELQNIIDRIVEETGIDEFEVLKSIKELKKSSMRYY
jgi:DNA-binding Lrp family transcriptional regulator